MAKRWCGEEILSNPGSCLPELCPSSMTTALTSALLGLSGPSSSDQLLILGTFRVRIVTVKTAQYEQFSEA